MLEFVHLNASYTLSLSSFWSQSWPVATHAHTRKHEHTHTHGPSAQTGCQKLNSYWIPAQAQIMLQHSACREEKKSRRASSLASLGGIKSKGNGSARFKLAERWLMEEPQWRITLLWKLNTRSYSTLSLTFIMCSIVCVCVCHGDPPMEAALLASFTTSPSCSSSQSATYCDLLPSTSPSAPPTFPYLCSCLFLSTSPFPLSMHWSRLISLVVSFPSLLHLLVFYCLSLFAPTFTFFLLPPSAHLAFISTSHNLSFFLSSACHSSCQSSLSLCSTSASSTAKCRKQRCCPGASTPWQARLRQLSLTWGRIPAKHQREWT